MPRKLINSGNGYRRKNINRSEDISTILILVCCLILGSLTLTFFDRKIERKFDFDKKNEEVKIEILSDPESYYLDKFNNNKNNRDKKDNIDNE